MSRLCKFDESDVFDGKVAGLFELLKVKETDDAIRVVGGRFEYVISKKTGQITSAKVLNSEYLADGAQFPDPYIGLFPEDDPDAQPMGEKRDAKYGFEKATLIKPRMFTGELTNSPVKYDAHDSINVRVSIACDDANGVCVVAEGEYADNGVSADVGWKITYDIEVDSFTRIDVEATALKDLKMQWHCYVNSVLSRECCEFMVPWTDATMEAVVGFGVLPPLFLSDIKVDEFMFGAHVNPYLHFGNRKTGFDYSKERFDERMAGYRDASAQIGDFVNQFDRAQAPDGTWHTAADSRGHRKYFTQVYMRDEGIAIEEFDIRNTTMPLNKGEKREHYFFIQLSPAKTPRNDLNDTRAAWPGPHQIQMVGWNRDTQWDLPSDEQIAEWKEQGVNLLVGGAHYFDGDTPSLTKAKETREFLRKAHDAGMKVIPYVTFNDFEFGARQYQELAGQWYGSKCIEFKNETTLMCFGGDGWREHFEKQVDWLLGNFDFDGLYIDHWTVTRQCNNARHGCDGSPFVWVTEGYHDIAKRARRVVARNTDGKGIMLMNSGGDPFAGAIGMFDLRLMGENIDMKKVAEDELMTNMNPERTGCHALVYASRYGQSNLTFNFAAAAGFPVRPGYPHGVDESGEEFGVPLCQALWNIHIDFDTNDAEKVSAFNNEGILEIEGDGAHINAYYRDEKVLLIGGRLPTTTAQKIDHEAIAESIREPILAAGLGQWVAEDIVKNLWPFFKPAGTTGTLDDLETSKLKAEQDESDISVKEARVERVKITICDSARVGMKSGVAYRVVDLLGRAKPSEFDGKSFEIDLIDGYPFALRVEPV